MRNHLVIDYFLWKDVLAAPRSVKGKERPGDVSYCLCMTYVKMRHTFSYSLSPAEPYIAKEPFSENKLADSYPVCLQAF